VLPRQPARPRGASTGKITSVKIALLILLGLVLGGLGGALLFGVIAIRDAEIAIEKDPSRRHDG
jgi:hypothetical protein